MGLSAGIIGLPNVGKSTIFNALSSGKASVENYPFCTIEPNRGVVAVPDERLVRLTGLIETERIVPAFLEIIDVAGLVKGAHTGEGLGNQFLGHIRAVDAIVMVVRCFRDPDVVHVEGHVDPLRDVEIVHTELMLRDLATMEGAVEKLKKASKAHDPHIDETLAVCEKACAALADGTPVRAAITDSKEQALLSSFNLLTAKRVLYVANIDEDGLAEGNEQVARLMEYARCDGSECVAICGQIEAEIAQLAPAERVEFLQGLGLAEPGLSSLARGIYHVLGLATFYTATPRETRAWPFSAGITAPAAAGIIHSDFERGFICADVYTVDDLAKAGTEQALRNAGKIRQEGRGYRIQDGDVVFFKYNV